MWSAGFLEGYLTYNEMNFFYKNLIDLHKDGFF